MTTDEKFAADLKVAVRELISSFEDKPPPPAQLDSRDWIKIGTGGKGIATTALFAAPIKNPPYSIRYRPYRMFNTDLVVDFSKDGEDRPLVEALLEEVEKQETVRPPQIELKPTWDYAPPWGKKATFGCVSGLGQILKTVGNDKRFALVSYEVDTKHNAEYADGWGGEGDGS